MFRRLWRRHHRWRLCVGSTLAQLLHILRSYCSVTSAAFIGKASSTGSVVVLLPLEPTLHGLRPARQAMLLFGNLWSWPAVYEASLTSSVVRKGKINDLYRRWIHLSLSLSFSLFFFKSLSKDIGLEKSFEWNRS